MGSAKAFVFAGAITLLSLPAANAADLPAYMPMKAPVVSDFSGWYLRGDIGMTNQKVKRQENSEIANLTYFETLNPTTFDAGWLFGLGVGYQFNSWLRADVTGEYRAKTSFSALDHYGPSPGVWDGYNEQTGSKSEWLAMANLYVDLGTWWNVTPFVGAGIGAANVTIHNFRDAGLNTGGQSMASAADASKWNLAWALHAGLAYRVTPGFTIELAYRYLDLGDGITGDLVRYDGVNDVYNPTTFKDITSHDVKLGIRWMLDQPEPAYSPIMRKG